MTLPAFTLHPTATIANAPFCHGYAFKRGDVPAGSQVVAPFADFQCTPKNAWPDGSLKFAILSGRANVTGTTPLAVQLSIGTPSTGAAIAANSISAVATVDCGTFGAVTWSGADWAAPFSTWIAGPKMSSFIYRKPVGSDPHLVAWLEVRVWSGGELEILPWIENGYFFVAAPTNKSATYSFTLGGTQRFSAAIDLKHHQRTPLVSGAALSHWLGADPGVTPFPSPANLQATELVPTYNAAAAGTTSQFPTLLPSTFAPLQQGGFNYSSDVMSGTGYQTAIGLLPTHDAAYFTCTDNPALRFSAVVRNGFSAGRYGIHFRDETTNQPPKFSTYPTAGLWDNGSIKNAGAVNGAATPAATGGNSPQYDPAHCPSMGFMAYMLTGRFYFMEETQFNAIVTHFCYTDWVRAGGRDGGSFSGANGASGICVGFPEMRTAAWSFRNLAQACSATPDGHPLQTEFVHAVEENCRYFNARYTGQSSNIFGIIAGGEGDYGALTTAVTHPMFMSFFVAAVWGYALAMDLPISATAKSQMAAFFAWKAKSAVGVLGDSANFWYVNGAPFIAPTSPNKAINYDSIENGTATWFATYKQAYDVMVGQLPPNYDTPYSTTEGVLRYEEASLRSRGVWGNLMPAIAYAARHNVPGAAASYSRVTGASNYNLFTSELSANPVWGIVPSGQTTSTPGASVTIGPTAIFDTTPLHGAGAAVFDQYQGLGIPISALAAGGTDGVGPLKRLVEVTDDPALEARMKYTRLPTLGTFLRDGLGGYSYTGSNDSYDATYYAGGALLGSATESLVAAGATANAPGATITGAATITGGTASAPQPAAPGNAPGADLAGTADILGGGADSGIAPAVLPSSAPGAKLVGTASISVGAAAGNTPTAIFGVTGPRSKARTFVVSDPQLLWDTTDGTGTFWNMSNPNKPKGIKDPNDVVDIPFDWRPWFLDADDQYASHQIITTGGLVLAATDNDAGVITAFVAGGGLNQLAALTCRVTTNSTPPRIVDRTVFLKIKDR